MTVDVATAYHPLIRLGLWDFNASPSVDIEVLLTPAACRTIADRLLRAAHKISKEAKG